MLGKPPVLSFEKQESDGSNLKTSDLCARGPGHLVYYVLWHTRHRGVALERVHPHSSSSSQTPDTFDPSTGGPQQGLHHFREWPWQVLLGSSRPAASPLFSPRKQCPPSDRQSSWAWKGRPERLWRDCCTRSLNQRPLKNWPPSAFSEHVWQSSYYGKRTEILGRIPSRAGGASLWKLVHTVGTESTFVNEWDIEDVIFWVW